MIKWEKKGIKEAKKARTGSNFFNAAMREDIEVGEFGGGAKPAKSDEDRADDKKVFNKTRSDDEAPVTERPLVEVKGEVTFQNSTAPVPGITKLKT